MTGITLSELHRFVAREIGRHERTNTTAIAAGKMTQAEADGEMLALRGLEHLVRGLMDRPVIAAKIRLERQERIALAKAQRNRSHLDRLSPERRATLMQVFGPAGVRA